MDTLLLLTDEDRATEERVDNLTGSLAKLEASKYTNKWEFSFERENFQFFLTT